MKPDLYTRLFLWLVKHRRWVLGITLLIAVASAVISSRIDLEEDILATLPQNDKLVDQYRYALKKFKQIDRVYIDVGMAQGDTEPVARAADELFAALSSDTNYTRIMYRFEMGGTRKVVDYLTGALPNLFTAADVKTLETKLQPTEIREYLTTMRRKLAGPEGMVLKDVVAADPIGMSALVVNKVLPLQTGFGDAQIVDGRITSGDGRHVLLMAEPRFPSSNSGSSETLVTDLLRTSHGIEQKFPGGHIAITGGHRMTVDNATLIKGDATRCIFLGMFAMLVLCLTAFRRRWLATVAFLPSLFGTLIAGVVLALGQKHLSAIATGFATIAIGITVDYAIYVIYHLDNAAGLDHAGVGRHVGRLVLPISVGALTTVAGFMVMTTSPMHGYQQLGIFGAIGVLFSAAFALVILPLLVPIPKASGQPPLWLTRLMESFHNWQTSWRAWLAVAMVGLTVAAVVGVKRLRFEGDIAKLNGITESTRRDEALIRETWGDALGMTLVVARGKTVEDALQQNDRAAEILSHEPGVAGVYSLASVCPSHANQDANIKRWREFWTSERQNSLRENLAAVGKQLGFRTNAFDAFWKTVQSEPALLDLQMFRGTPLDQALNERTALAEGDNAISTLIKLTDSLEKNSSESASRDESSSQRRAAGPPAPGKEEIPPPPGRRAARPTLDSARGDSDPHAQHVETIRHALPGMIVLDQKAFASHIAELAKSGLGNFSLWTAIIVAVIVYLSVASAELVIATLLPIAFGLLWTFGAMGWLGLPIDMMNSVFVIFIIGIGEDYAVFLMTSKLDEWRGRPTRLAATSASVLISALSTIFGFAVLVFAHHPVLFSMGSIVLLGMGCTFAATLVLTPLCMDLLLFNDPPRGAPRWWHLLGTAWVTIHLGGSELFLYYVLRPILKLVSPAAPSERGCVGRRDQPQQVAGETRAAAGPPPPHSRAPMLDFSRTADARLRRATSWMARGVVKGMPFGKLELQNISPETFSPPCIVISNHQSAVDVMLMVALPADVRQTAKKRIFDTPILGIGCKLLGHVMVEPNDPQTTLQRCREKLAEGACVHFYPEGTRSHDGYVQRFHRGAFELAIEQRLDILPVVLCDAWTAMPRDAYWFEPYHVTMRAWPRVTPQTFDYSLGPLALARHCEKIVRDALQAQRDEINTPRNVRRKVERLYRYQGKFVEQFVHWKMKLDPMFPLLDRAVPRQACVLDLGCGYGIATHWLSCFTDQRSFVAVDYDEDKIRVARRTAPNHPRIRFEHADLLAWEYPPSDAILLLDVLHYWQPEKQQIILNKARAALRPGGVLVLREAAQAETGAHRKVHFWERIATSIDHNQTKEGLHFQTLAALESSLRCAGFKEIQRQEAGDSNVLFLAKV